MISLAYAALWMYVFSMQCEDLIGATALGAVSRIIGMPALGLALLAALSSGRVRRLHGFHIAALLFVICVVGGQLFLHSRQELPNKFWTYVQLLLVLWIIWEVAPTWQRLRGLLVAYVFGSYVAALGTIMLYFENSGLLRRFSVGGGDANDLAMTLALGIPMAWYIGMTDARPFVLWAGRAFLPVGVFAIGLTASRGGMVAGIVGLMIVPLFMTKLSPGRLAMIVTVLGLSGILAVTYIPEKVVERLASTGTEVETLRLGGRFKVWQAGFTAFTHKPLMGYGTSRFKLATDPFGGYGKVAHNSFISVLVEQGLIGFLLYMLMFVTVFLALLNLPRMQRRFALVLLATLFTAMMPLTWESRKQVWFVLAWLVGMAQAYPGAVQLRGLRTRGLDRAPTTPRSRETLTTQRRNAELSGPA
jgi:O-antigen ligase